MLLDYSYVLNLLDYHFNYVVCWRETLPSIEGYM